MPARKPAARNEAALVLVDVINAFDFPGGDRLARAAFGITPRIERLRARFDAAGAPVIHANDNFAHWQQDFGQLVARCQALGGHAGEIATRLAPRPGDYHVLKAKHSAFLGTPLDALLASLGVRRLVLCGLATDSCVLATAQDAKMREFAAWIPGDAVAAMTPARHAAALAVMAKAVAFDVRQTRSVRGVFPAAR